MKKKAEKEKRKAPFRSYETWMTVAFVGKIDEYDPGIRFILEEGLLRLLRDFCKSMRGVDHRSIDYSSLVGYSYDVFHGLMLEFVGQNPWARQQYRDSILKQMTIHASPRPEDRRLVLVLDINGIHRVRNDVFLFADVTERRSVSIH